MTRDFFKFITIFIFFISYSFYGQIIKGTVSDTNEAVPFLSLVIKRTSFPESIIQYTETDSEGKYEFQLSKEIDSIWVEVISPFHEPQRAMIRNLIKNSIIVQNFELKPRVTEIKEIIIETKKAIEIKNDTTNFNPRAFIDGSEKVVEDLLRKIPGIKVEENGEIKYKGKKIKKLLLENDDLFGNQYTNGSRNIDVEMVETVQAVEHYNENPLLNGLINSDEVAINLKLKEGKTDFSGTFKPGYGIKDKYQISSTALIINKKVKGFGVISYNNAGENSSPYSFRSSIPSLEDLDEANFLAPLVINEGNFYSQLNNYYSNINDNLYGSINVLFKLSSKISVKTNLGAYDDRLQRNTSSFTEYFINDEQFSNLQTGQLIKKPRVYNAAYQITGKPTDSIIWDYSGKINYRKIDYTNLSTNNGFEQYNTVNSENFYTKHDINFTGRINEKSALTSTLIFSYNNAPQNYTLTPGLNFEEGYIGDILNNYQISRFEKKVILGKARYLYKLYQNTNLDLSGGYYLTSNNIYSLLDTKKVDGNYTSSAYQNAITFRYKSPYISGGISSELGKRLRIDGDLKLQYFDMSNIDYLRQTNQSAKDWVFIPNVNVNYKLNAKSALSMNYSYSETGPSERNMFKGIILTSYRSFLNNEPDFRFLKTHSLGLNYNFQSYLNFEKLNTGISYYARKNNYFYRTQVDADNSISTSFLLPTGNRDIMFSLDGEKYLHLIRTTFQLESNYTLSYLKNIINNSDIRNVQYRMLKLMLAIRPGIKGPFNLENRVNLNINSYFLERKRQNDYTSLSDVFKVSFNRKKNFKANALMTFLIPNTSQNNHYLFLDAEFVLTSKSKKFEYTLTGRNLTNNTSFKTFSISDYYYNQSSYNLIGRVIILSVNFRF